MRQKTRRAKVRYAGVLAQRIREFPIPYPGLLSQQSPDDWNRLFGEWMATQQVSKLSALFAHYGIEEKGNPAAWHLLVLKLAHDHVPGFQLAAKRGAPKRNEPLPKGVPEIERLMHTRGISVSSASRLVARKIGRGHEGVRRDFNRYQAYLRRSFASIGRKRRGDPEAIEVMERVLAEFATREQWDMHLIAREMLRQLTTPSVSNGQE